MTYLPQNRGGRGRPDKRFGMAVVMGHVVFDGADQIRDTPEGASANPLARDLGEPALDRW